MLLFGSQVNDIAKSGSGGGTGRAGGIPIGVMHRYRDARRLDTAIVRDGRTSVGKWRHGSGLCGN